MIMAFTYYDATKRIVPYADVEDRSQKYFKKGTDEELDCFVEKMSKRKGNVVNPDEVINEFGADAMRVYLCFLGPLEQDKPWAPDGIAAQHSWLRRFWRLFFDDADQPRVTDGEADRAALKAVHKAIDKVSDDIERLALNTAISALHIATRDLTQAGATSRAVLEPMCQLIQPFAPHIAEHIWAEGLGHKDGISRVRWPKADPELLKDDAIKMGVQVLGKTRGEIEIPPDADEETAVAAAKASPGVAKYLEGKNLVRVIYKPGKILNLIAK